MSAPHLSVRWCRGARLPWLLLLLLLLLPLGLALVPGRAKDDTAAPSRAAPINNTSNICLRIYDTTASNNTDDTATEDSRHTTHDNLRGCCRAAFDYIGNKAHTTPQPGFTIPTPAPQGVPETAGKPSGILFKNNSSLGGVVNEKQMAVTVPGDAAGTSSTAEATAAAAPVEVGSGTISSNSNSNSSSSSSSHGGGVSSQHSQLTPSDTHHIHTALQGTTEGVGARAATAGPFSTPPTPITARPHLASGPTGAMLRRLARDPAGSISEPAGAS